MNRTYVLVGVVLAFLAGVWTGHHGAAGQKTVATREPQSMAALPIWKNPQCVPANKKEYERFEIAASTLERIAPHSADWLSIGAERALSQDLYRSTPGQSVGPRVCSPPEIYARVASAFAGNPIKGRFDLYEIELASHMQLPPVEVVDAVAQVAFEARPVIDDDIAGQVNGDIRPIARTVLAGFGRQSAKYASMAFDQVSSENSLGTGAAQVAAAGGHPEALSRIESLMNQLLASVPDDKPIPLTTRDRLYELAWAISVSGDSAKDHVDPLIRLMGKQVQSGAPPFGLLSLHPKRMCAVLFKIYGEDTHVTSKFPYCTDDSPLESYPRGAFALESVSGR
ncbi:hypothetical protein GNZ12_25940 [Paraburkholderia sp. 1N]|uniref:Uncharacterized protein n=1 Tax=Paraburkholderia solitsugae TaxID=2675748 RepID=A0ABX2BUX2_9BURK|nr:hypothetical protein [Paraburkholderia solitsugae]NPT44694.1 hypothetical protein [Paraburkholderia solitsugae]